MFDFGHRIAIENSTAKKPLSYSVAEYRVTNYPRGASASCMLPALHEGKSMDLGKTNPAYIPVQWGSAVFRLSLGV
jgi:hypothetical protein